eukprot:5359911-Prymnesium_polylepis.3
MSDTRPCTVTGSSMAQKPDRAHSVDCALKGAIEPSGTARATLPAPSLAADAGLPSPAVEAK